MQYLLLFLFGKKEKKEKHQRAEAVHLKIKPT